MAKSKRGSGLPLLGRVSFIGGLVIAILAGLLFPSNTTAVTILILLGLVVGLLNVTDSEATHFLVAIITLLVVESSLNALPLVGDTLGTMLNMLVVFIAPAAVLVAVKQLLSLAKN
ncbi:MAG: hypothetical protein AABW49_03810 [Nanoarchaeota archaeon]